MEEKINNIYIFFLIIGFFAFGFSLGKIDSFNNDPFMFECNKLGFKDYYIDMGTIGNVTLTNIICTDTNYEHIYQIFTEPKLYNNRSEFWKDKIYMYELNYYD